MIETTQPTRNQTPIKLPANLISAISARGLDIISPSTNNACIWKCTSNALYNHDRHHQFIYHTTFKLLCKCYSSFRVSGNPPSLQNVKLYRKSISNIASVNGTELQALATCLGMDLTIYQTPQSELKITSYSPLSGVPYLIDQHPCLFLARHEDVFWLLRPTNDNWRPSDGSSQQFQLFHPITRAKLEKAYVERVDTLIATAIERRHLRQPMNPHAHQRRHKFGRPAISLLQNLAIPEMIGDYALYTSLLYEPKPDPDSWFGPSFHDPKPYTAMRFMSQNVRGLLNAPTNMEHGWTSASFAPLHNIAEAISHARQWGLDILALQDTQLSSIDATNLNQSITSLWQKEISAPGAARVVHSPSPLSSTGGTTFLVAPSLGCRVRRTLTDFRGWGRFVAIEIAGHYRRSIWLLNIYVPPVSSSPGSMYVLQQQGLSQALPVGPTSASHDPVLCLFDDLDSLITSEIQPSTDRKLLLFGDFNIDPLRTTGNNNHRRRLSSFLGKWSFHEPSDPPNVPPTAYTFHRRIDDSQGITRPDHVYISSPLNTPIHRRLSSSLSLYKGQPLMHSDHWPLLLELQSSTIFLGIHRAVDYHPTRQRKSRLLRRILPSVPEARKKSKQEKPKFLDDYHEHLKKLIPKKLLNIPQFLATLEGTEKEKEAHLVKDDWWRRIGAYLIHAGYKTIRKPLRCALPDHHQWMPTRPPCKPIPRHASSRRSHAIWGVKMLKDRACLRFLYRLNCRFTPDENGSLAAFQYLRGLTLNPSCRKLIPTCLRRLIPHAHNQMPNKFPKRLRNLLPELLKEYRTRQHAKFRHKLRKQLKSTWDNIHENLHAGLTENLFKAFKQTLACNQDVYAIELPSDTHEGTNLISDPKKIVDATRDFYADYFSDNIDGEGTYEDYLLWQDSIRGLEERQLLATSSTTPSAEKLIQLAPPHLHEALITILPHLRLHTRLSDPAILADIQSTMSHPISTEEWSSYWSRKPATKSTGYSSIPIDVITHASTDIHTALLDMVNHGIMSTYVATPFKERVLKSIPKATGDTHLDQQRPIQLLHPIQKASQGILSQRYTSILIKHGLFHPSQHAFIIGKSTQSSQFLHTTLVEDAHTHHTPLLCLHVDLRRAFDSVHHIWGREISLRRMGCPESLIQYLLNSDRGNKTYIHNSYIDMYDDSNTGVFEAKIGFAQGAEDSPLGYIIFKDILLSYLSSCTDLDPPTIAGITCLTNCYADDLRLYSTTFTGLQKALRALELSLRLFRGQLKPTKSFWNAILWDDAYNQINSNNSLTTSEGITIPYKSFDKAVRDLGFKTSMDLQNNDQLNELQLSSEALAHRITTLHQMSSSCAYLLDQAVNVPKLAYACSYLPVSTKALSKLDKSNAQVLRGKFNLPPTFPNALLHAFPLGVGRLGLLSRIQLDRWSILASHLTCPPSTIDHKISIALLDQLRLSINLPSVASTAIGENLFPPASIIRRSNPNLRHRWLYPLMEWLPHLDIGLINCSNEIPSEVLNQLLGRGGDLPKARNTLIKHQAQQCSIYSYSDGSYQPESSLCAYATRIILFEPQLDDTNNRGTVIYSSSHCIEMPIESANPYIAEFLGLITTMHVLSLLIDQLTFSHPLKIEHRLDNSSVVTTSSSYQSKTPYQWLRIAGEPFWRCFYMVQSTFPSSSIPTIKWQRSHPERQSSDRISWSIHEYHNFYVDQAATNALKSRGQRPNFNPISLCPGPVWCRRTPEGSYTPLIGPLRSTIRALLGHKSLYQYLDDRHRNNPTSFPIHSNNMHLPSITSAWKQLSAKKRSRFTRILSGWLPTATRIAQVSKQDTLPDCFLCKRHHDLTSNQPVPAEDTYHFLSCCPSLQEQRREGPTYISDYVLNILNKKLRDREPGITNSQLLPIVTAYWSHLDETRCGVPLITTYQWVDRAVHTHLPNKYTITHLLSLMFLGYLHFAWDLWLQRNHMIFNAPNLTTIPTGATPPENLPPSQNLLPPPSANPDYTDHLQI